MFPVQHIMFRNITEKEYRDMELCRGIRTAEYEKDCVLFHAGDYTEEFGIVIFGKVHIENIDLWGNRVILHSLSANDAFGETYAFCNVPMLVDVTAAQNCKILFLNTAILLSPEYHGRSWYFKLISNLLFLSTQKNLAWSNRIFCMTAKSSVWISLTTLNLKLLILLRQKRAILLKAVQNLLNLKQVLLLTFLSLLLTVIKSELIQEQTNTSTECRGIRADTKMSL